MLKSRKICWSSSLKIPVYTYIVGLVSQCMHVPCQAHLHVVYKILRYLKDYLIKGMIYTNHGYGELKSISMLIGMGR